MSMHKSGRNDNVTPGSSCKGTPGFDRIPAVHMPANVPQSDTTLGDYIARKQQQVAFEEVSKEKKLTWGDWYFDYMNKNPDFASQLTTEIVVALQQCWLIAQENK